MTLCQICFWLAPRWTRSRMLCYHGPIFQRPRGRRAQREFTRAACQWVSERLSLCVCGWPRVWGMSVVVTISVSVRANVSLSSEIRDVIGFWASLRKKNSKGAASANKTQIWRTTENLSGLPMLPTNADEQVTYTAPATATAPFVLRLVITLFCTLLRIMRVVRPQRQVGIQIRSLCDLLFFPRIFKLSLRKIVVPCSKNVSNTLGTDECKGSAASGNRYVLEIKLGDKVS